MSTGQRAMVYEKVNPGSRLNVQALPSGTYLVRVTNKGQSFTEKIVVSH